MHIRACFWKPIDSEHVNESQKLQKSPEECFDSIFSSSRAKLNWIKLFLIRSEILELPDNTLTADLEYSRSNIVNLTLPIQIKLSKKPQTFCWIFILHFQHLI